MKVDRNWVAAAVLSLPFAWVIAFLLFMRPIIFIDYTFILPLVTGFILGLVVGGFVTDRFRGRSLILVLIEVLILIVGIVQWILPPEFWVTLLGRTLFALILFLFGYALVLFTVFLNRLVSSVRRGQVVGLVAVLILLFSGVMSFAWRLPIPTSFAPAATATLLLLILLIAFIVQPWKGELQIYMVPGSIRPYVIWWVIYLAAFGLYIWATPFDSRTLTNSLLVFSPGTIFAELVLIGLAGAMFVFTFLPDKLGRKLVFNVATLLLGLLCIFGGAQIDPVVGNTVSSVLLIVEAFVIAFIFGVGAWLVWAEIGPVGIKGRRAAFGWIIIGLLGGVLLWITIIGSQAGSPLLVYPIAASLVLISIFPLTNAREVVWNERKVEDIDVSVDSRQVSRAIRDLEVDTSLKSIEGQIETEIAQLTKIKGITKGQAKELRDAGYETPELVARADANSLVVLLGISPEKAEQIIMNAKSVQRSKSKSSTKRKTK